MVIEDTKKQPNLSCFLWTVFLNGRRREPGMKRKAEVATRKVAEGSDVKVSVIDVKVLISFEPPHPEHPHGSHHDYPLIRDKVGRNYGAIQDCIPQHRRPIEPVVGCRPLALDS